MGTKGSIIYPSQAFFFFKAASEVSLSSECFLVDGAGVEKIGSLLKLEWEKEGGGRLLIFTLYHVL